MTDLGTTFGDTIYETLSPVTDEDASLGYPLRTFVRGAGTMFQLIDWIVRDTADGPGWSRIVNIDKVPLDGIPWLAQFIGVTIPAGLTEQQQRDYVKSASGWRRGTRASMIAAIQPLLTGTKAVTFRERDSSAYHLTITTKTSETPNPAAVLAALLAQKPAGIVMDYHTLSGQDYQNVFITWATYALVNSNYSTYQNLLDDITGVNPIPHTFGAGTFGSGNFGGN